MPDSCRRSMPLTADRAMTGAPSAPYATGAVLAMSDRPAACKGANPNPINMAAVTATRSEEHTSELQSLMRISYAVFCLKKKKNMKCRLYHRPPLSDTINTYSQIHHNYQAT